MCQAVCFSSSVVLRQCSGETDAPMRCHCFLATGQTQLLNGECSLPNRRLPHSLLFSISGQQRPRSSGKQPPPSDVKLFSSPSLKAALVLFPARPTQQTEGQNKTNTWVGRDKRSECLYCDLISSPRWWNLIRVLLRWCFSDPTSDQMCLNKKRKIILFYSSSSLWFYFIAAATTGEQRCLQQWHLNLLVGRRTCWSRRPTSDGCSRSLR